MFTGAKKISLLVFAFFLQGCPLWEYLEPPAPEPNGPRGELSEAREVVYSFLHARIAGEPEEELRAYLTSEAWNDYREEGLTLQATGSPGFVACRIQDESVLTEGRFGFTVLMQEMVADPLRTDNVMEDLIVGFDEEEYRISSARLLRRTRVRAEEGVLVWNRDEKGKKRETRLVTLEDLPPEMEGQTVGREAYSALILSPLEKGMAFGTQGENGLVAFLNWEESGPAAENPFLPVTLLPGGTADLLIYSPDGRYLAVETEDQEGNRGIAVYETGDEREEIVLNLEEDFPSHLYTIALRRWEPQGKRILIRVDPRQEAGAVDQGKLGTWSVAIPSGEKEKLLGG
ncbi:MAG: hypothetical protein GX085_01270 [Firmicutes bacterium]|nr:hypothetical protein [Bacillota bacterium]